jgi:t-SNARE complex subunit (syntaxin)
MDVHQIDFIPKQSLDQLNEDVQLAMRTTFDADFNEIRDLPLDLQRAEALEALGISEFYYGVYNDALEHLEKSLSYANTLERRGQHRIIFIKLLVILMFMVCLQFFLF